MSRNSNREVLNLFFFFQAEDGIRDVAVTGVQTCALPISPADGDDPAGVRGRDVLPRDSDVQRGDRDPRHPFGAVHGFFDRARRGVNINYDAFADARRRRVPYPSDVDVAVVVDFPDDRTHLGGPDIQSDDVLFTRHGCPPATDSGYGRSIGAAVASCLVPLDLVESG